MFLQQNIINQNMNDWIFQFPFPLTQPFLGKAIPLKYLSYGRVENSGLELN